MSKEYLNAETIAIIDGADGPTGVFMVGGKRSIKVRIKDYLYRKKQKNVAKKIIPQINTNNPVTMYAVGLVKYACNSRFIIMNAGDFFVFFDLFLI